jgi:aspartyl-tRNA(Asn)/glutamyl-tRNA(Gln) amidotransferase subunit C
MGTLTRADVEHVAHLARLGLTDEELTRLEGQLNHILDQYEILAQLDTDAIPPTAQTIKLENILRDDVARPSLTVEEALANAPARDGDHVVVPAIIGGEQGSDLRSAPGGQLGGHQGTERGGHEGSHRG